MRLMTEPNNNLIGFIASTVEKLSDDMTTMRDQMATKEDLARLDGRLTERLEATQQDLARLDGRFTERLQATSTAIRGDIKQIQLRLDSMEHSISFRFEHVEGELTRLRSAVYILGKERPEVLRLLGQSRA
jgi:hypothetical protein